MGLAVFDPTGPVEILGLGLGCCGLEVYDQGPATHIGDLGMYRVLVASG